MKPEPTPTPRADALMFKIVGYAEAVAKVGGLDRACAPSPIAQLYDQIRSEAQATERELAAANDRIRHLEETLDVERVTEMESQASRLAAALEDAARALNVAAGRLGYRVRPTTPHGQLLTPHPWEDEAITASFKAAAIATSWHNGRAAEAPPWMADVIEALECAFHEKIGWKDAVEHALASWRGKGGA